MTQVVWIAPNALTKAREVESVDEDMNYLKVVDRCMREGNIVASAADPLGQVHTQLL